MILRNILCQKNNIFSQSLTIWRWYQQSKLNIQWDIWMQTFECTLKHIPIQMNQSNILTNMSTQVVICHPVYEEKCAFNITISIKQDIPHYNKLISISIDPVTELLACIVWNNDTTIDRAVCDIIVQTKHTLVN